jgi:ClpP class serine protease
MQPSPPTTHPSPCSPCPQLTSAIAQSRALSPSALRRAMDQSPLSPQQAHKLGLLDAVGYLDQVTKVVESTLQAVLHQRQAQLEAADAGQAGKEVQQAQQAQVVLQGQDQRQASAGSSGGPEQPQVKKVTVQQYYDMMQASKRRQQSSWLRQMVYIQSGPKDQHTKQDSTQQEQEQQGQQQATTSGASPTTSPTSPTSSASSGSLAMRQQLPKVAVITAQGQIQMKSAQSLPGSDTTVIDATKMVRLLRAAREAPQVKAVVLRIDTPGGDALASDLVHHEVVALRQAGKPVVVSMGEVCASGGYYIACAASQVVAQPGTITGSIGVFAGAQECDASGAVLVVMESLCGLWLVKMQQCHHVNEQDQSRPLPLLLQGLSHSSRCLHACLHVHHKQLPAARPQPSSPLTVHHTAHHHHPAGTFFIKDALARYGIDVDTFTAAPGGRQLLSAVQEPSRADRRKAHEQMDIVYGLFRERVAQGRGMSDAAVRKVAKGRVWTGGARQGWCLALACAWCTGVWACVAGWALGTVAVAGICSGLGAVGTTVDATRNASCVDACSPHRHCHHLPHHCSSISIALSTDKPLPIPAATLPQASRRRSSAWWTSWVAWPRQWSWPSVARACLWRTLPARWCSTLPSPRSLQWSRPSCAIGRRSRRRQPGWRMAGVGTSMEGGGSSRGRAQQGCWG